MPKLFKKLFLCVIVVAVYFGGVRKLRNVIHDAHIGTILPKENGEINSNLSFYTEGAVSFSFTLSSDSNFTSKKYKIPFGLFFLLPLIGLVILGTLRQDFFVLISIHLLGGIISFLALIYAIPEHPYVLIIPDMLSRYLIPLLSLGLVALSYLQKKNSTDENGA